MRAVKPEGFPADWKSSPIWSMYRRVSRKHDGNEPHLSVYRDLGVVSREGRTDNWNRVSEDVSGYQLVLPGDLVVNKMKAWQGSMGVSMLRGVVSPAYFVFEPLHQMDHRFMHHLLRSKPFIDAYGRMSKGIRVGQWDLDPWAFSRVPVSLPTAPDQARISDLLESNLLDLDAVIEKQRALADGLRAMRSAEISSLFDRHRHAMRPLKRLLVGVDQGVSPDTSGASEDADFWVLKAGCSNHGVFNPDEAKPLPHGFAVSPHMEIKSGDLIVSRASGSPGLVASAAIVGALTKRTLLSDKTFRLVVSDERYARSLYWYMNSLEFRNEVLQRISGADGLANNIPLRELRNIPVPMYSAGEAAEISNHLDREVSKIDALLARSERLITLSQERRTALITAAVTGQIDITTDAGTLEGAA